MRAPRSAAPLLCLGCGLVLAVQTGAAGWSAGRLDAAAPITGQSVAARPVAAQPATSLGFELVGQVGGLAAAVAVDGDYAFLVMSGRLLVFEVSSPAQPRLVAETAPTVPAPRQAFVTGGHLYLVDPTAGVQVFDVRDPAQPRAAGMIAVAGGPRGMAIRGAYAYIASGAFGLQVVDVSDPSQPAVIGILATPRYSRDVALAGDYAYVAERDTWLSGVWVVDVSDPRQPKDAGFVRTPGGADFIVVVDRYAYVLAAAGQLWVLDLRDPVSPVRRGWVALPGAGNQVPGYPTAGPPAYGITVLADYVYVARGARGLEIIDVGFPGRPLAQTTFDTPGDVRSVALRGRRPYAYLADWHRGLRVVDLRDPASPSEVAAWDTPADVADVAAGDGFLCLADTLFGLRVADTANPSQPKLVGQLDTLGLYARGVAAVSYPPPSTAAYCVVAELPTTTTRRVGSQYIREYKGGLQVIDVSDPAQPDSLASINGVFLTDVVAANGHLYAASMTGAWRPPLTPGRPGDWMSDRRRASAGDLASGRLGYGSGTWAAGGPVDSADDRQPDRTLAPAPDPFNGIMVFDFARPAAPDAVGWLDLGGSPIGVAVDGALAYVAADSGGLHIVDVSDPYHLATVAALTTTLGSARVQAVAASGGHAFVATIGSGLRVIDVTDPTQPRDVGGLAIAGGGARDVALTADGAHAVVADAAGVHLVDVSDPTTPQWLDYYSLGDAVEKVTVALAGDLVYVGVDPARVLVLRLVERPVPTPSPAPTATPTPSPAPTATAAPTATPKPPPAVYLPLARKGAG